MIKPVFVMPLFIGFCAIVYFAATSFQYTGRLKSPPHVHSNHPRAALVTIFSERRKSLLRSLPSWHKHMPWMRNYSLVVLYANGSSSQNDTQAFAQLAPTWKIILVPFNYDLAWQNAAFTGQGGGGAYINKLLAYDMYFEIPELQSYTHFMRLDDDVEFFNESKLDPFLDMARNRIQVGWAQHIFDNEDALGSSLFSDVQRYVASSSHNFTVSDVWSVVSNPNFTGPHNKFNAWRPYLTAGCVELYAVNVFQNEHYKQFLLAINAFEHLRQRHYWDQEVKTMWQQIYVPAKHWKSYACALPVFHKTFESRDHWFLSSGCNFETNTVVQRGRCDADPLMRFC